MQGLGNSDNPQNVFHNSSFIILRSFSLIESLPPLVPPRGGTTQLISMARPVFFKNHSVILTGLAMVGLPIRNFSFSSLPGSFSDGSPPFREIYPTRAGAAKPLPLKSWETIGQFPPFWPMLSIFRSIFYFVVRRGSFFSLRLSYQIPFRASVLLLRQFCLLFAQQFYFL